MPNIISRIVTTDSGLYVAELFIDGVVSYKSSAHMSRANAILKLNRKIESVNIINPSLNIPHYKEDKPVEVTAPEKIASSPTPTKSKKPRRQPFTPYGLNGYLVDKHGNVRLHLDRRANAQTIVLTPEMFRSLAEMVERTFSQGNENA